MNIIKFLFGWPLSLAALFFIAKIIVPNIGNLSTSLLHINFFFLFLSLCCFFAYYLLRCFFWQKLLRYKNHALSLRETSYLWSLSEIKRFIPGNIWSFLGRTTAFSAKNVTKHIIITSLITEAEFLVLGSTVLSLAAIPFLLSITPVHIPNQTFTLITGIILFFICIGIFLTNQKFPFPKFLKHILPQFSLRINFSLLGIACLYTFFFGLGTYFSIHALFFLNPQLVLILSGFFVFAFLAGYLSLIAPMGLGIREGVLTMGLSHIISVQAAGFAAIFARIILICAELLFLCFVTLWHKTKSVYILSLTQWTKQYWQEISAGIMMIIYSTYFTAASFARYTNFYTGRFDLGNMDQTVWNTLHGRIFQFTNPDGTNIISRLAFHADFFLILLTPFYVIWQDPRMLLFIQTIILGGGILFVFLIAKKVLKNKTCALLFSVMYTLNPSIQYTNLYDFHAVTAATTFFLGAYYFLLERKLFLCTLFLLLAALTKEQVWVITAMFGGYMILTGIASPQGNYLPGRVAPVRQLVKLLGLIILLISSIAFYFIFFHAIPQAHGGDHFAFEFYSDLGKSKIDILKTFIFSPQKIWGTVFAPDRLGYLFQLFLPFGFIPFLAPLYLIFIIPDLFINLLSNNIAFHQIYYQYTAIITPFLFIATIHGIQRLSKISFRIHPLYAICYMLFATLVSAYLYGPLPGAQFPNIDMFIKPQPNAEVINTFLRHIPKRYSIAATNNLGSHLSHRQKIFTIPTGIDQADIVMFLLNDKFATPSLAEQKKIAENMKHDKKYKKTFELGDFVAFEKIQ